MQPAFIFTLLSSDAFTFARAVASVEGRARGRDGAVPKPELRARAEEEALRPSGEGRPAATRGSSPR
jgi:hypothetical protein